MFYYPQVSDTSPLKLKIFMLRGELCPQFIKKGLSYRASKLLLTFTLKDHDRKETELGFLIEKLLWLLKKSHLKKECCFRHIFIHCINICKKCKNMHYYLSIDKPFTLIYVYHSIHLWGRAPDRTLLCCWGSLRALPSLHGQHRPDKGKIQDKMPTAEEPVGC